MADRFMPSESWRTRRSEGFLDGGMTRVGLAAGAVVAALGLGYAGYAMLGHSVRTVPVVEADPRPIRIRPDNPGGMQLIGADDHAAIPGAATATAPPPEAPAPQALRAKIRAETALARPTLATAQSVSVIAQPPEPPSPASAMPEQRAVARAIKPGTPGTGQVGTMQVGIGQVGTMQVQLAATGSEQAAHSEWQRLTHRMPALLASRQPAIQRAEHEGHAVWRLRTGNFADTAAATAFCAQIRSKGVGCSLASF